MRIHVRPATVADLDDLVANAKGVALESEALELDDATVARGVKALLDDPAKGRALVAEADGRTVGSMYLTAEWSDWHAAWYWWIQSAYVRPTARGKGVFRALHEAACAMGRQEGAHAVRLYVERHNERGLRTYQRLGMTETAYLVYEQRLGPA